jgi:hypothetical protein
MKLRYMVIFLLMGLATPSLAAIGVDNLPPGTLWYFHVDFARMRTSDASKPLYGWLQHEVFAELEEESGIDLDKETDTITAFAAQDAGVVIVIDGNISQQTKDKLMAIGAATGTLDKLGPTDATYYFVKGEAHFKHDDGEQEDADGGNRHLNVDLGVTKFNKGAYFSFARKNKLIVTSTEGQMQSLLANKGRIPQGKASKGALIVLGADRSLVQAGVQANALGEEVDWDSNILRNTEQAALLVADAAGKIAVEAQLITTEHTMADSLASIVRGLISLQAFNSDLDPEISSILKGTTVDVDDRTLTLRVSVDPQVLVDSIE